MAQVGKPAHFHQQGFESELKDTRLFLVGNAGPARMHH